MSHQPSHYNERGNLKVLIHKAQRLPENNMSNNAFVLLAVVLFTGKVFLTVFFRILLYNWLHHVVDNKLYFLLVMLCRFLLDDTELIGCLPDSL